MTGEAAGAAVCLAIDNNQPVQEISYDQLKEAIDFNFKMK